jgi:hypothetical protein
MRRGMCVGLGAKNNMQRTDPVNGRRNQVEDRINRRRIDNQTTDTAIVLNNKKAITRV